jgi:hypothetical protein
MGSSASSFSIDRSLSLGPNAGTHFEIDQGTASAKLYYCRMPTFVFRCPNKNVRVQGWTADDPSDDTTFGPVECVACRQLHYVNPTTGRVLGSTE